MVSVAVEVDSNATDTTPLKKVKNGQFLAVLLSFFQVLELFHNSFVLCSIELIATRD